MLSIFIAIHLIDRSPDPGQYPEIKFQARPQKASQYPCKYNIGRWFEFLANIISKGLSNLPYLRSSMSLVTERLRIVKVGLSFRPWNEYSLNEERSF